MTKSSTRVHVRGNAGTQILQAAAALSQLGTFAEPIICVNHGNLDYDGTNKLDLFFDPHIRIINVDMTNKTPYWKTGVAERVFNNRPKIFQWLKPKPLENMVKGPPAYHMRTGDKEIISQKTAQTWFESLKKQHADINLFTNDASRDWYADWIEMYNAEVVYGTPSAFLVSMLLFDPTKQIVFLDPRNYDGSYDVTNDLIFLQEAMEFCPNVSYRYEL